MCTECEQDLMTGATGTLADCRSFQDFGLVFVSYKVFCNNCIGGVKSWNE